MTCSLWIEQARHSGIALDVSATGLFIQTSASPAPGASVTLELNLPGSSKQLVLHGHVARKKVVPARLVTVAQGGVGVRIENAPEEYYAFIAKLQPEASVGLTEEPRDGDETPAPGEPASSGPGRAPAAEEMRFRVRIRQVRGSRSRALQVTAVSEDAARRKAMAEIGEDWQILACEPSSG